MQESYTTKEDPVFVILEAHGYYENLFVRKHNVPMINLLVHTIQGPYIAYHRPPDISLT